MYFATIIMVGVLMISTIYIIDPCYQFRMPGYKYFVNQRFCNLGLIRNYEYDTMMVGSSMTQNFDMRDFDSVMGTKSLRTSFGGIRPCEITKMLNVAYTVDKAKKYYVCIDIWALANPKANDLIENRIVDYNVYEKPMDILRYSFSYENWFRFLPIDMGFLLIQKLGKNIPKSFEVRTEIPLAGRWNHQYKFGKDIVVDGFLKKYAAVSSANLENIEVRFKQNIDAFFANNEFDKKKTVFFFPPYSVLYWANTYHLKQMEHCFFAKSYFIEKAIQSGCEVHDFQSSGWITDLDKYKDTTHYHADINTKMLSEFKTQNFLVDNCDTIRDNESKIRQAALTFYNDNEELFCR